MFSAHPLSRSLWVACVCRGCILPMDKPSCWCAASAVSTLALSHCPFTCSCIAWMPCCYLSRSALSSNLYILVPSSVYNELFQWSILFDWYVLVMSRTQAMSVSTNNVCERGCIYSYQWTDILQLVDIHNSSNACNLLHDSYFNILILLECNVCVNVWDPMPMPPVLEMMTKSAWRLAMMIMDDAYDSWAGCWIFSFICWCQLLFISYSFYSFCFICGWYYDVRVEEEYEEVQSQEEQRYMWMWRWSYLFIVIVLLLWIVTLLHWRY